MSDSVLLPGPGQSITDSEINPSPYQPPGNIWDNSKTDPPPPPAVRGVQSQS